MELEHISHNLALDLAFNELRHAKNRHRKPACMHTRLQLFKYNAKWPYTL